MERLMSQDPSQAEYDDEEYEEEDISGASRFLLFLAAPAWLVSLMFHFVLLLAAGLISWPESSVDGANTLEIADNQQEAEEIAPEPEPLPVDVPDTPDEPIPDTPIVSDVAFEAPIEMVEPVALADDIDIAASAIELTEFSERTAPQSDLLTTLNAMSGEGLEGRGVKARSQMVKKYGGSADSEAAVAAALKWITEHQLADGGWSFDHTVGSCKGRCKDPGNIPKARNGATALALLPYLGSGQTHTEGEYKKQVKGGLNYLVTHIKPVPGQQGVGSFHEPGGSMYSHGLAAITLSEAYAMTQDRSLIAPAQASLNYISYAQDPVGGGWRYSPKQAGDTSAVGWQIMALKSGHLGYLDVPKNTIAGASKFLDHVSTESGSQYGYTGPQKGRGSTTAVGLLCRMYLGWKKDTPALNDGIEFLAKHKPSKTDMYFNYYATQVMRQEDGKHWERWNISMRDYLVGAQDKSGHQIGSWHFNGGHGASRGGRLYNTSLSTMILEVYYRHMPIYGKAATEEDFPL